MDKKVSPTAGFYWWLLLDIFPNSSKDLTSHDCHHNHQEILARVYILAKGVSVRV